MALTRELLAHHPGNQSVYIQVTRGVPAKRDHVMPEGPRAHRVHDVLARSPRPSKEAVENGVACLTARDFRWEKCHIKSTSLLGNVLARQLSADAGAAETILFRDGFVTEASASNVFVVKDGRVVAAAPQDNLILLGITYDLLVQPRRRGRRRARGPPVAEARAALGRRDLAVLVHQGGARRDHARRQARRRRQAGPGLPAHARALPGLQGEGAPPERRGGLRRRVPAPISR